MRIIIDMQGAQTENRQRGIGRYTLALAKGLVRNRGPHEVVLALNSAFPESIEAIRAEFERYLPQDCFRQWHPIGPSTHIGGNHRWNRKVSELIREAFIASLKPDVILLSSLFEGLVDNAATSIGHLASNATTAVILYDLIPHIHRKPYLENPDVALWYDEKLAYLRLADLQLAISESSRKESITSLESPQERVVAISTAADPEFRPITITAETEEIKRNKYGLCRPFVMYTGGIDHRKNIEGLIRAYAKLTAELRQQHQLAIVCSVQPVDRLRLQVLAEEHGLAEDELVLTDFVPDEDLIALYNLCKVFVFPSWHEGFGLPALEAMACGRAVIGSNCSSLPEVIGCPDALFDPRDDQSIANKLQQVLTDSAFRQKLEHHGLEQSKRFSWDNSASLAIAAMEDCHKRRETPSGKKNTLSRPRLAYVSPLPPDRSGIADYSAELLPELARHYDIEVIVAQDGVADSWVSQNCPQRSVEWFLNNATRYDRVIYHFGNSGFHQHMFSLLERIPGVVVLHDFFLSGIISYMEYHGHSPVMWFDALYSSHGYHALQHRFTASDTVEVVWKYPCNLEVLQNAHGVIVHSEYSRRLAQQWYGKAAGQDWRCIPLLRSPVETGNAMRMSARERLGLRADQFVVCSFGLLGPTKLNHRLVDAWLQSPLAADIRCQLVFVGGNEGGTYGAALNEAIAQSGCNDRIRITGWADAELFRAYLHAADVGVQLRTLSRGETSATVLDCMNHGIATIVNANGSMADLPDDGVWKLPDDFDDEQLTKALTLLYGDKEKREKLGARAQQLIRTRHDPTMCATLYAEAIEGFHRTALNFVSVLAEEIAALDLPTPSDEQFIRVAKAIDLSISPSISTAQILVDISELVQRDVGSGIQRVVRSILREWLLNPPSGIRIEPVYATANEPGYRYARKFTLRFLGCPDHVLQDEPVTYRPGDHFIGLDLQPRVVSAQRAYYQAMRQAGVRVQFVVYDLLCVRLPQYFVPGGKELLSQWLNVVAESDGALCISKAVADELTDWMDVHGPKRLSPFTIEWFHLGADIDKSVPAAGLPADAGQVLERLRQQTSCLMVGTLEPRKGHAQVLDAFEQLWQSGTDVNLAIVGKQGWMVEALAERLRHHPELNQRLHWLEGISDEYLEKVYAASTCLIAASYGEGFGLPLIEAAQHKLPIIARDIPVFREVAGAHVYYFDAESPEGLAQSVQAWLEQHRQGTHPKSIDLPWLTWRESAGKLCLILTGAEFDK